MKAVRYVGKGSNYPKEYLECLAPGSGYAVVDPTPRGGNVTVRAELDGNPVQFSFDEVTRDFFDLSTLVYVVDEMAERQQSVDHWSRNFQVVAPVADPGKWSANQIAFGRMLRTLAGDEYSFTWCQRQRLSGFGKHRISVPRGYDAVCLFSGGIDSFLGAHRLLASGQRVLLVGHQAEPTTAAAQTALADVLKRKFLGKARLLQFRVARSRAIKSNFILPDKCEETHRPRSLLFLALAVGIAKSAKVSAVYMPENGLIALNPPFGKSRMGTLSTRTAHPRYLTELADLLKSLDAFNGAIKNPFLFQSKTDMLRDLDPSLHAAMQRSVSCSRPSRYNHLHVRHCGYCMPCIYRRIAMIGPGLDSADHYAFDVFKNLSSMENSKQVDFRSLVGFAKSFLAAGSAKRQLVVLSHGSFPPSAGNRFGDLKTKTYQPWSDMIERWAADFLEKLKSITSPKTRKIVGI